MKRITIAILMLLAGSACSAQKLSDLKASGYSSDISAGWIFGSIGKFDGTQDIPGTFWGAMTWYKQVSKKNYTVNSFNLCGGFRISRSGYKMSGYSPYAAPAYYTKYNVTQMESMLMQHFVTIPIGVEWQFHTQPVVRPRGYSSLKLMLNNSVLLFSNLKETVAYTNSRTTNITKYAPKYVPGLTFEAKAEFIIAGVSWQKVNYKMRDTDLNINDELGSPFYEAFSSKGSFKDFYWYLGVAVRLKSEREQRTK